MQPVPRVLVLTDLVDSTRLVEGIGDARAVEVWLAHDRAARALLAQFDGREIDRTDGFLLIFERTRDAVGFATAYHRAMAELSATLDLPLRARVGVHTGPVVLIENPPEAVARGTKPYEIEGLAKPLAARVMSVARGGQTLLSAAARAELGASAEGLVSHGFWRFKGIIEPSELFEAVPPGEAPQSPPADSEKVWRVARRDDLWVPVREIRHHLPAERDRFLAREAELAMLAERLHEGDRLVTVTGMGGTGKTRFVTRFGHLWLGDWPGGAWFCELVEARDIEGVCAAVARAIDVPLTEANPVAQLGHALAGRGATLVILDNFEHLVHLAGATVGRWLEAAPNASFVVTSRETLGIRGEHVLSLAPLPLHGGEESPAASLFIERARAARPDFRLTPANAPHVARLVELLDGIPLAIELAAARATVLSPAQLVERMSDRFRLLVGKGSRGDRPNTLRATIDSSWELLGRAEQAGLAQLSVFPGPFALEAALAVLDLSGLADAPWPEDVLQNLVGRSLLRTLAGPDGAPVFVLLTVIQSYAAEKLASEDAVEGLTGAAQREAAEARHGAHFAALDRPEALRVALDDLLAAARRAIRRVEPQLATRTALAAWAVLELRGPLRMGADLLQDVLRMPGLEPGDQGRLLNALGLALRAAGRTAEAATAYASALDLARQAQDPELEATALDGLGFVRKRQGQLDEAEAMSRGALALYRRLGRRSGEGEALSALAVLRHDRGERREAVSLLEQSLAVHQETGNRRAEANSLGQLGRALHGLGQTHEAQRCMEAALAMHREVGDRRAEGVMLTNLGSLLRNVGRPTEAAAHYASALAIAREMGNRASEGALLGNIGLIQHDHGHLDEARRHYEQALVVLREVGNRAAVASMLGNLGNVHVQAVRGAEARRCYEDALELHRALGTKGSEGFIWLNLCHLLRVQGRYEGAAAAQREAMALHAAAGDSRMIGACLSEIAQMALDRGQLEGVEAPLADATRRIRAVEDRRALGELLLVAARYARRRGSLDEARGAADEGIDAARAVGDRQTELELRCESALAWLDDGETARAQALLDEARARLDGGARSLSRASLLAAQARIALANNRPDEARGELSGLAELLVSLDATPEAALSREAQELAAALV